MWMKKKEKQKKSYSVPIHMPKDGTEKKAKKKYIIEENETSKEMIISFLNIHIFFSYRLSYIFQLIDIFIRHFKILLFKTLML